jgi:hypothetical protein
MNATPANKYCLDCGYNLRGLERGNCPECGRWFDPEERWSWSSQEPVSPGRRLAGDIAFSLLVGCIAPVAMFLLIALTLAAFVFLLHAF